MAKGRRLLVYTRRRRPFLQFSAGKSITRGRDALALCDDPFEHPAVRRAAAGAIQKSAHHKVVGGFSGNLVHSSESVTSNDGSEINPGQMGSAS